MRLVAAGAPWEGERPREPWHLRILRAAWEGERPREPHPHPRPSRRRKGKTDIHSHPCHPCHRWLELLFLKSTPPCLILVARLSPPRRTLWRNSAILHILAFSAKNWPQRNPSNSQFPILNAQLARAFPSSILYPRWLRLCRVAPSRLRCSTVSGSSAILIATPTGLFEAESAHVVPVISAALGALPAFNNGVANITALYTARFGVPPAGSKVFVSAFQYASGWSDFPVLFSGTVPGGA